MSVEALFVQRGLPRSVQCIHIAFLSMVIMLCLHHVYQDAKVVSIAPRGQVNILGHTLSYEDLLVDQNEMRQNLSAKMVLDRNREMQPSMRYYMQRDVMVSKPAIWVYGLQEIYLLLHEISKKGVATIEVQLHSFLRLLIVSVLLMVVGLIKRRSEV
jgi:cytochrome c biogenesis factor